LCDFENISEQSSLQGKTETVKALGAALGRMVLVFNCDETFDFTAMTRIFIGLCQCGAWGCFDEFNRLEERILSAISQQILTIQNGLRDSRRESVLSGKNVKLDSRMGLFITVSEIRLQSLNNSM